MKDSRTNKIRLLVIGDNHLLREGIRALIEKERSMKVVGSFGDGETVLPKIRDLKPSVVLLDLGLKSRERLTVVKAVSREFPGISMIVMDLVPTHTELLEFIHAGVSGFILKDVSVEDFLSTIRQVAGGGKVLPTHLTGSLFTQIAERDANGSAQTGGVAAVRMTKRERQVIELVADGETNKGIALKLHVSTFTIKSHVHNILEKLGLHTRVQIARYAHTEGNNGRREEVAVAAQEGEIDLKQ